MHKAEIDVGHEYGMRVHPRGNPREPLVHVEVVSEPVSGQVEIRHRRGRRVETIKSRQLVCRWDDREAFLSDEARLDQLKERQASRYDSVMEGAANVVIWAAGEEHVGSDNYGCFRGPGTAFDRLLGRTGLTLEQLPGGDAGFTDRHGETYLPLEAAVHLAKTLATLEPDLILLGIDQTEREYIEKGYQTSLAEDAPAWALAREWAGHRTDAPALIKENARLRRLVELAIVELRLAGLDDPAGRLQSGLTVQQPFAKEA